MGVSKNSGTLKSSIFIGFSIINHPFWSTPIVGNAHILIFFQELSGDKQNCREICPPPLLGVHVLELL